MVRCTMGPPAFTELSGSQCGLFTCGGYAWQIPSGNHLIPSFGTMGLPAQGRMTRSALGRLQPSGTHRGT